jgi:hypothetical protein
MHNKCSSTLKYLIWITTHGNEVSGPSRREHLHNSITLATPSTRVITGQLCPAYIWTFYKGNHTVLFWLCLSLKACLNAFLNLLHVSKRIHGRTTEIHWLEISDSKWGRKEGKKDSEYLCRNKTQQKTMKTVSGRKGKKARKYSGRGLQELNHHVCTGITPRHKSHWHPNDERQEWKTGEGTNRRERVEEGSKEGEYSWFIFLHKNENGIAKPVEITTRGGLR